jgi:hypothetical protein
MTKFQTHVHPETYVATDPLEWRTPQLHTKAAACKLSDCTFADHTEAAKVEYVKAAASLRTELASQSRALKAAARRASAALEAAETHEEVVEAVEAIAATEPTRKARPAAERRNETTHPHGESAVATLGCPTCSARKAVRCVRHDGEHTNHVHAARMKAWEAKGSPAATLPAKAVKAAAKKSAAKAGAK